MTEAESESMKAMRHSDWPLRPWLLAGLLGLAGLLIHFTVEGNEDAPARMALAAFFFFGSLCAAFSLERDRWKEVGLFALAAGLVMAGLAWRATQGGDHYLGEQYGFFSGVLATLLALPLFQADFHRKRFATPYRDTHFFVWTDAVGAGGALAFVGATWLMLFVLAALFGLIRIELLNDLIGKGWFGWAVSGAAFGAALGVLRNHLKLLGTLQSVVMLVLSLLAVPLAVGLMLFLLAMIVSGPQVLWQATQSATPILLSCAAGAFVLANAIVRDDDTDMTRSAIMRVTSFVLALSIFPLAVFAAISMGTRIAQYGFSPERLWALIAIAVACAYGIAAIVAAIRGRVKGWRPYVRQANLDLAVVISIFALFLALPILDFGSISAKNQVARLERGAVTPELFDYDALRWDFGDAGREQLARLAGSSNAKIAQLAQEAQQLETRPWQGLKPAERIERAKNLHMELTDPALRAAAEKFVKNIPWRCDRACVVIDLGKWPDGSPHLALVEGVTVEHLKQNESGDFKVALESEAGFPAAGTPSSEGAVPQVEARPFNGRRIYVDGKPVGIPFE